MKQPDFVEFQPNNSDTISTDLESPLGFSRVREVSDADTINIRKHSGIRKHKTELSTK